MMRQLFGLTVCALVLGSIGCTTSTISNLTPSRQPRNANGLYSFEVAFATRQQSLRKETLRPQVVIGLDTYPMRPTSLVQNRWETLVPIPADKEKVYYRIKFDYDYNSVPIRRGNSKLSPPYELQIVDQ